jgi:hypothetical protein
MRFHKLPIAWTVALGVVALVLALWLLGGSLVTRRPPSAMTEGAMTETMFRMEIYLQQKKQLPGTLAVLPLRQGHMNSTTDGWGRPLIYTPNDDGYSLKSLGKDGVVGGVGDDADIMRSYRVVNGVPEEVIQ